MKLFNELVEKKKKEKEEKMKLKEKELSVALWDAIRNNNIEFLKTRINAGANVNYIYHNRSTALMLAIDKNNFEIVKILIESGADVNLKVKDIRLLYFGGDNYTTDFTPLMCACAYGNKEIVKALIETGANINDVNERGWSALILACMYGRRDVVKLLIEAGADVNCRDNGNVSGLMYAAHNINPNVLKVINRGFKLLLFKPRETVEMDNYKEIVETLINAGADVSFQCEYGTTALHAAVGVLHLNDEEVTKTSKEVIHLLVNAGADPYIEDCHGHNVFDYLKNVEGRVDVTKDILIKS